MKTTWGDDEDAALQGVSIDAQVIYLRAMRRYMDYDTGITSVSLGVMKRVIEFIPDPSSKLPARRVADVSNDYIRARCAELERVGLAVAERKKSRFDSPRFFLAKALTGLIRTEYEPQQNPKSGTPSAERCDGVVLCDVDVYAGEYEPQQNPKVGTPRNQVSGIDRQTDISRTHVDGNLPWGGVFEILLQAIPEHVLTKNYNRKQVGEIVSLGVTDEELRVAMVRACDAKGEEAFGPSYVKAIIERARIKPAGGGNAQHGGGGGGRKKLSASERAAEQDRRHGERDSCGIG